MCDIVFKDVPQEHDGSEAWFQQTRLAAHQPWPVRKWFNVDHKRRCRSNPGGAMEGSTINERFTTSKAAHSSVHFCHGDTSSCRNSLSHTGRLDVRQTPGWTPCLISGKEWNLKTWSYWEVDLLLPFAGCEGEWCGWGLATTEEVLGVELQRQCAWIHSTGHQSV